MLALLQAAASPGWVETGAAELATWLGSLPEGLRAAALGLATFLGEDITTIFAGLLMEPMS